MTQVPPEFDGDKIFHLLRGQASQICFELSISPLTFDQLIERTGLGQPVLSRIVAELREKGVILPSGGRGKPIELRTPELMREFFIALTELGLMLATLDTEETKKRLARLRQAAAS